MKQGTLSNKAKTGSSALRQTATIQPKLMVNAPGDRYEQEADAMAERVMRMPMQQTPAKPVTGMIARSIQRKTNSDGGFQAPPGLVSQLGSSKGGGSPLPEGTRSFMENAFSADFSQVRVHTGGQAAEMSEGIQAKAFTHREDIYFSQGQYNPHTREGEGLLAHELTHTLQQSANASNIVQRMKWIFEYGSGAFSGRNISGKVEIHTRTIDEWKKFLINDADTEKGNIELNVFMALCLGGKDFMTEKKENNRTVTEYFTPLNGQNDTENFAGDFFYKYTGGVPSEERAIDLMEAFLFTGKDSEGDTIDLPDYSLEGISIARPTTAILMAKFNEKYVGKAIVRKTKREQTVIDSDDFYKIKDYVKAASSQMEATQSYRRIDPSQYLMISSLGTAIGAVISLTTYNDITNPYAGSDLDQELKNIYNIITNCGKIIHASIEGIEDFLKAKEEEMTMIFDTSYDSAVTLLSAIPQTAAYGTLLKAIKTPIKNLFKQMVKAEDMKVIQRKLLSCFEQCVQIAANPQKNTKTLNKDQMINANSAFANGMNF